MKENNTANFITKTDRIGQMFKIEKRILFLLLLLLSGLEIREYDHRDPSR
jgi:hypothetical protein